MGVEGISAQNILPITENKSENKQVKEIINSKNMNSLDNEHNQDKDSKAKELLKKIEADSGKIEVEQKGLEFSIHDETKQIVVKVIDRKTKEVVREIPPEKVLDMMAQLEEYIGLFIDEKK